MSTKATSRTTLIGALVLALAMAGALALVLVRRSGAPHEEPRLSVLQALGPSASDAHFARAVAPREFKFPEDHGPHPAFRSEWWYWTGNLEAPGGRRFGYQLTIFRTALAATPSEGRTSAWAADQVYLAHFALSDVAADKFYAFERTSRGALGLAGAEAQPFRVWILDWSAEGPPAATGATPPMHLRAANGEVSIDLTLEPGKPIVLQGERGLSQKGKTPGNASYYYSLTRMPSRGTVAVPGGNWQVEGASWMDREWSTSALDRDQVGWDWFALQLSDGRDLMVYRLRDRDGSADPASSGTLVEASGESRHLSVDAFTLVPEGTWQSPHSGKTYPAGFAVRIPSAGLDLEVTPLLRDQELNLSFRYWEGGVKVEGRGVSAGVTGRGYLELTGYGDALPQQR